jgi:hypothetical protein
MRARAWASRARPSSFRTPIQARALSAPALLCRERIAERSYGRSKRNASSRTAAGSHASRVPPLRDCVVAAHAMSSAHRSGVTNMDLSDVRPHVRAPVKRHA